MNKELGLVSIVRRKKPTYESGEAHKKFDNLINQNFTASGINQKWATDYSGSVVKTKILDFYNELIWWIGNRV